MSEQKNPKRLYTFSLPKELEIDKKEDSTNEKGEKVTITKKVKEKIDQKFFVKRPTRSLRDEAELFYGAKNGEAITAGLIPHALLAKRFENDNGTLSKHQIQALNDLWIQIRDNQGILTKLRLIDEKSRTEEDKKKIKELDDENFDILKQIQEFRNQQYNLFDNTPEVYARNKTIFFWFLNLAYKEVDGKEFPYFGEGNFDSKLNEYDILEEKNDEFENTVMKKFLFAVSIWYSNGNLTQEEFDKYLKAAETEI